MIVNCSLWRGSIPRAYEHKLNSWLDEHSQTDHTIRLSLDDVKDFDNEQLIYALNDDGAWVTPDTTVVFDNINKWKSAELKELIAQLQDSENAYTIALIQREGAVLKPIESALTEDEHDERIPFGSEDELSEWIEEWLDEFDIEIDRDASIELALHAGEDMNIVVDLLHTLRSTEVEVVDMNMLNHHLDQRGILPVFKITEVISRGDGHAAVDLIDRLMTNDSHPIGIVTILSKRFRLYAMSLDSDLSNDKLATLTKTNPKAMYYVVKEANKLGPERLGRCYNMIREAMYDLKGGSALDEMLIVQTLVTRLARQFQLSG